MQGKMKQEGLIVVFFFYQLLGVSRPQNKYIEISMALVVPLAPEAPGDNQCVYTSLNPEWIQPCDNPRFFLLGKGDMAHCC